MIKRCHVIDRCGLIVLFACIYSVSACRTTTVIDEYRIEPATIAQGESIVVLGRRHDMDKDTERDFIQCVGEALMSGSTDLQVIPEAEFVDAMYPWFEVSTAPMDVANMERLLENPAVADRLEKFRLRYFVWIDGFTATTDSAGSVSCAVGPGGGGCLGFKTWDDESNYEASIWDLEQQRESGKINAETSGTSYVPALIVPIPLLARVKATACSAMADQLLTFIQPYGA